MRSHNTEATPQQRSCPRAMGVSSLFRGLQGVSWAEGTEGRAWGSTDTNPCKIPLWGSGSGSTGGGSGPWICWICRPPSRASARPGELWPRLRGRGPGDARERASVCVGSAGLLSPACSDATLFLFPIFTADFSFTRASASAAPQFLPRLKPCGFQFFPFFLP